MLQLKPNAKMPLQKALRETKAEFGKWGEREKKVKVKANREQS